MNVTTVSPTASGDNENVSPLLITLDIDVDAVGTVNADIKLVEGSNKIVITVTAPNNIAKAGNRTWNNTKKVYVINIYRGSENDNADLIDIKYTAIGIKSTFSCS